MLQVLAVSDGDSHFIRRASVELAIINVNDEVPAFTPQVYTKDIDENRPVSESVIMVQVNYY